MKYSIEVRTKTPDEFLVISSDAVDINDAFNAAANMKEFHGAENFVQIKDENGEIVAVFGKDAEIKS